MFKSFNLYFNKYVFFIWVKSGILDFTILKELIRKSVYCTDLTNIRFYKQFQIEIIASILQY